MGEAKKQAKVLKDPFKTKKTRSEAPRQSDTVEAPDDIAQAIDHFRECQDQAKHFEGEATVHKDQVVAWAQKEYAKRMLNGQTGSFKIVGNETMVTYVIQDSSAGLTEEEVVEFAARWGESAAEKLITRDFRSIRFDPNVLAANYEAVVDALQSLPEEVLEHLFKPMLMMAQPGALETARAFAKSENDLQELLTQLKIKNYVR